MQVLRLPNSLGKTGYKKSQFYKLISEGLLPKPIKLCERNVGWLSHELDEVLKARAAGMDEGEIKALVEDMEAARRMEG